MNHIKTYPVSSFLQKGIKVIMIDKSVKSTGYRSAPPVNLTQTCFKTPTPLSPSWKWSHFQGKTFSIFTVSLHQDPRPAWDVLGLGEEAGVFLRRSPADTGKSTQTLHWRAQLLHHPGLGWSPSNPEELPPDLGDGPAWSHRSKER